VIPKASRAAVIATLCVAFGLIAVLIVLLRPALWQWYLLAGAVVVGVGGSIVAVIHVSAEHERRLLTIEKADLDAEKLRYDLRWGWVTPAATIITILLGILTYAYTWNRDRYIKDEDAKKTHVLSVRESKKPYLDTQLALYNEVARLAAQIALDHDPSVETPDEAKSIRQLRQLKEGRLLLFGDLNVNKSMERFLNVVESNNPRYEWSILVNQEHALVRELTRSIERSWDVENRALWDANPLANITFANRSHETTVTKDDYFELEYEARGLCGTNPVLWVDFTDGSTNGVGVEYGPDTKGKPGTKYGTTDAGAYKCDFNVFRD
jgi:hypothetical protein